MRRLPPLAALPAFEAAARLGSMTAAAAELGRTHSAISKQVAHLQDALGVALFEREGVGVRLTPEGAAYAEATREALGQIERATRRLTGEGAATVTVKLSGALAARWLIPRLPGFQALRPDVDLRLAMAAGGARFGREGGAPDVLLSWDRLSHPLEDLALAAGPGRAVRALGDAGFGPVAAPSLGAAAPEGRFVAPALIENADAPGLWPGWAALSGRRVEAAERRAFPNTSLCVEAATAGLGAAVVERRLVERELAAGALVAPAGFAPWPGGFVAVAPRRPRRAVSAFLDWLAAEPPRADLP
jgi:DNA-binding transcriptional LysR family regulator